MEYYSAIKKKNVPNTHNAEESQNHGEQNKVDMKENILYDSVYVEL